MCHCVCFVLFCFYAHVVDVMAKFDCICLLTLDAVCFTQYIACHYIVKTG